MAVRLEKVVLTLEDHFTTEMARAAAATALLDRNLDSLSGSAVRSRTAVQGTSRDVDHVGRSADRSGHSINQLTGRIRIMADAAAVLGPSLVPIGAAAAAGVAGLVAQFGFATLGALSLVVAAQGVGDALKAVEAARLEPTAENIAKAQQAMAKLAPEAREFVARFQELRPVLGELQQAAARGWFPGITEALGSLESAAPRIERILEAVSKAGGDAVADGAASLAGDRWRDFFDYIEAEAPGAVTDLSRAVGSLTHGLAELLMVMDPGNDGLREWLVDTAAAFDDWATNLDDADVAEFFDYLAETGPKVAAAAGALANAILQIVEAAAPLGGPSLKIIEAFADAVGAIADSDLGTPILAGVAALSLYTRELQVAAALQTKLTGSQAMSGALATGGIWGATKTGAAGLKAATPTLSQFGTVMYRAGQSSKYASEQTLAARSAVRSFSAQAAKGAAPIAGLAVATTGIADGFGLANTTSLALLGTMAGPWGAAIGAGIGLMKDLDAATLGFSDSVKSAEADLAAGRLEDMADTIARLRKEAKDSNEITGLGDMFSDVGKGLGRVATGDFGFLFGADESEINRLTNKYNDALSSLKPSPALRQIAYDFAGAAEKAQIAADALQDFATEYADLNATLSQQAALIAYQASIDNLTESIKRNGRTLDINSAQGRENRDNLYQIAEAGARASESMIGLEREQFLRGLIRQFKDGAEAAGGMDAQARAVLQNLRALIGVNPKPKVTVDTAAAREALRSLRAQLDAIRSKNITVSTTFQKFFDGPAAKGGKGNRGGPIDPFRGAVEQADGGLVVGPGGPRDDKVPTWLSNREYVIPAHIVDEFGVPFFDALRGGEFNNAEGLASGGQRGKKGKRRKNEIAFLGTPGTNEFFKGLDFDHLGKSVRRSIKALEDSKQAIENEVSERQSLAESLESSVTDKLMSQLFGQTDVWTAGATFEDVMASLNGDTAAGLGFIDDVATLRAKGLDEEALAALLAEGDTATIDAWAELSADQLKQYEDAFNRRAEVLTKASTDASTAAFGAVTAPMQAQLVEINRQIAVLTEVQKTAEKTGPAKTGAAVGKANKRGAGNASRNTNRSQLVL